MEEHQRDEIWNASFDTFYDSYYEEIAADLVVNRWQYVDETAKVLVALTVSGSAVSGWVLWNQPYFQTGWAILAGFAAVLAIVHATLGVPGRLGDLGDMRRYFGSLRIDLETFRQRMKIDPRFPVEEFTGEFVEYRRRYAEGMQRRKNDILITDGIQTSAQNQLNDRLGDMIEQK